MAARRTIYGKVLVSGVICYIESYSETTANQNETLSMLVTVAGHEVESFDAFYFNDEQITVTSNAVQVSLTLLGCTNIRGQRTRSPTRSS